MDWDVHRIAASEQYRTQPWDVLENWSLAEVEQAHKVLDFFAECRDATDKRP